MASSTSINCASIAMNKIQIVSRRRILACHSRELLMITAPAAGCSDESNCAGGSTGDDP
jgi:hypothetical protein